MDHPPKTTRHSRDQLIIKKGSHIYRPLNVWSKNVHEFLAYLHKNGFKQCPQFVKVENNKEVLMFVEGNVFNYPLKGDIASTEALISATKLLKAFHKVSASYLETLKINEAGTLKLNNQNQTWMLQSQQPYEVICHGDFAPYNLALNGKQVVGVFDFDTIHPAPKLWDVAYAIYCFAPFKTNQDDKLGELSDQIARAKIFCDAYELDEMSREKLVPMMIKRLTALVEFMTQAAANNDVQFQDNLNDGHHLAYRNDIRNLQKHEAEILKGLKITINENQSNM